MTIWNYLTIGLTIPMIILILIQTRGASLHWGGERAELRVAVPNRPGVIADLALAMGRAGINISDMSLSPSPDNTSGEVALWVAAADADRAADLIAGLDLPVTR